jgi:putative nucleotidyltransferase with HDIG domain
MKNLLRIHRRLWSRYLLVALAAAGITMLIPKSVRFPYTFEEGKPWRYDNLLAPYDFPIRKTETELSADRARVEAAFIPFYEKDSTIVDQVLRDYERDLGGLWVQLSRADSSWGNKADSARLQRIGRETLHNWYRQGLLEGDSALRNGRPERYLYQLEGNEASLRLPGHYLDTSAALGRLAFHPQLLPGETAMMQQVLRGVLLPNVHYLHEKSQQALNDELSAISPYRGKVSKGEKIVFSGELISPEQASVLHSYREEFLRYSSAYQPFALWFGYFSLVAISLTLYTLFLLQYRADVLRNARSLLLLLLLITSFIALTIWSEQQGLPTLYVVPYCIAPIIIRTFFGTRTALFTHLVVLLVASFLVSNSGEFLFLHLLGGLAAIFSNLRAHYWSRFFTAMGWLLLTYALSWLAIGLVQHGSFAHLELRPFGWLALNVFICLMAYPLILVFERLFGMVSDITLRELSDLNKPLLRELSLKAPGTMQHSVQVANLAEAAIAEIEGNALLTRVGALYHDIGKIRNPVFFVENQARGDSPHDALEPEESARMILSHVPNGLSLGREHRLPDSVLEFIRTHHGTTRVEFFWNRFEKLHPELASPDDARFRYPGPLPVSRETAVVMLADSLEAASRALQQPSQRQIEELVSSIIQYKIQAGQLVQSELSYRDMETVRRAFCKMLMSIHHVRVAYPQPASDRAQ